jgi:hypothetical protein
MIVKLTITGVLGVPPGRHRWYNDGARMRMLEYEHDLNELVTNPLE